MSELVERISRAMEPEVWIAVDRGYVSREKAQPCLDKVRKGLEAMREPTEAMVEAGMADWLIRSTDRSRVIYPWQAMIDAALSE